MRFKVRCAGEGFFTLVAGKWFRLNVEYLVDSQTSRLGKIGFTYFAVLRSFIVSVTSVMSLKVPLVSESLVTLLTRKWFFSRVNPMVLYKVSCLCERFLAMVTDEYFQPCFDPVFSFVVP